MAVCMRPYGSIIGFVIAEKRECTDGLYESSMMMN